MTESIAAPVRGEATSDSAGPPHSSLWALALGSIGVVYGDIGTSPLYALREAVIAASGAHHEELTRGTVLGVVSLILWALFIMLAKSASDATDFFQIPTGRVVEVGTQVTV